jgi:hypothetical protein
MKNHAQRDRRGNPQSSQRSVQKGPVKSATARLLPDAAREAELRDIYEAHDDLGVVSMPGMLSGHKFDPATILSFLAQTISNRDEDIRADLLQATDKCAKAPANKKEEQCVSLLRSRVELAEIVLLARELERGGPGDILGKGGGAFVLPFDGLGKYTSYSIEGLIHVFCEAIHLNADLLSPIAVEMTDASLAQALSIAEEDAHRQGFATEFDEKQGNFVEPTALQLQAWEITALAFEKKLAA